MRIAQLLTEQVKQRHLTSFFLDLFDNDGHVCVLGCHNVPYFFVSGVFCEGSRVGTAVLCMLRICVAAVPTCVN